MPPGWVPRAAPWHFGAQVLCANLKSRVPASAYFHATPTGASKPERLSKSKLAMVGEFQLKMCSNCSFILLTWIMKLMISLILVEKLRIVWGVVLTDGP